MANSSNKENPALPEDTVFALVSLSEGKADGCTYAGRKYKGNLLQVEF